MMLRVAFLDKKSLEEAKVVYGDRVIPVTPGSGEDVAGYLDCSYSTYESMLRNFSGHIR